MENRAKKILKLLRIIISKSFLEFSPRVVKVLKFQNKKAFKRALNELNNFFENSKLGFTLKNSKNI